MKLTTKAILANKVMRRIARKRNTQAKVSIKNKMMVQKNLDRLAIQGEDASEGQHGEGNAVQKQAHDHGTCTDAGDLSEK